VAAAPFVIGEERRWSMPWRVLQLPVREPSGPMRCNLLLGQAGDCALQAFLGWLVSNGALWDVARLQGLPVGGAVLKRLAHGSPGMRWRLQSGVRRARWMAVPKDWRAYLTQRSKHLRKHLNQERTRLNTLGQVEMWRAESAQDVERGLAGVRLILERHFGKPLDAVPAEDQRTLRIFNSACARFAGVGALDVRLLRVDGEPAACLVSPLVGRRAYPLLTKYDPCFAWASPGRALIAWMCEDAVTRGWEEIDFLSDWDYLHRLTDGTRDFSDVHGWHAGWRSRLHALMERAGVARQHLRQAIAEAGL
jgi:CelD/BcsL family acetyltransferase involved in cellulose biosynthesis